MSTENLYRRLRRGVLGILRYFPRLRFFVRKSYWFLRKAQYKRKYRAFDVDSKTVFFESYGGRFISCSPLALCAAMCSDVRFSDWHFVWSVKNIDRGEQILDGLFPDNDIKIVKRGSKDYFLACAQSAYWIVNSRMPEWIDPETSQVYVQCWHGTPLKRLGFDLPKNAKAALNTRDELCWRFKLDAKKWTCLLSPSPYTTEHLLSAFGATSLPNVHVIEEGYPRNDAIISRKNATDNKESAFHLKQILGIPHDKKVLLYAPTWRESDYISGSGYVAQNYLNLETIAQVLGDEWIILTRTHYYVSNTLELSGLESFAFDVSKHNDINELYFISDVLLTDYSSVAFDYANTLKPLLFYWPDLEAYKDKLHGFYLDLQKLPGPKCFTMEDVLRELKNIETWGERHGVVYKEFHSEFCPLDDGKASERVISRIFF